jgi:hypothetical protein
MGGTGFDGWIEIFQGGKQTAANGRVYDGDRLIDQAVASFSTGVHEPPLVIGHPKDDAPAYGWVDQLRKSAKSGRAVLEARFKQIPDEVKALVQAGRFKKRSAAFYGDGRLRHVGLLGAQPPAVKGLADVAFSGGEDFIHFEETAEGPKHKGGKGMEVAEFFEHVKKLVGLSKEIDGAPNPSAGSTPEGKVFSEAEVQKRIEEAEKQAKEKAAAEFAEKEKAAKAAARKADIKARVKALVDAKKVAPAFAEELTEELVILDQSGEIEFGEGQKGTRADKRLAALEKGDPKHAALFQEITGPGDADAEFAEAKADAELGAQIAAKVNPPAEKK